MRQYLSLVAAVVVVILDWLAGLIVLEIYHRGHFRSEDVLQWLLQPFLLGLPFLGPIIIILVLSMAKLAQNSSEELL